MADSDLPGNQPNIGSFQLTPLSLFLEKWLPGSVAWIALAIIYCVGMISIVWLIDFGGNPAGQYVDIVN